ncbi:hypothetical protein ES332_D09G103500v1 [Gossypium tomentosum]|uniref:Thionin-like protein 2 n=1 Tax=Gossypium tomentosum TaxID=34277 RepID=A0A5D2JGB5_GOSTO|nr:hypothetical protein ES332_D09G103500v1 [Gossypium tomentosum]
MEKRGVSVSWVICLVVLGVLVGQSTAQLMPFGICYASCFATCTLGGGGGPASCSLQCLKNCLLTKSTVGGGTVKDTLSFCKLGCASALCSNFSTSDNPASNKVGNCVDGCSATCAKKNL